MCKLIGIIGNKRVTNVISSDLKKNGYLVLSIEEKVKELAAYLIPAKYINKEKIIKKFRDRGYKVNKLYWLNILMSSINSKNEKIAIMDMEEDDVVKDIMVIYRVNEENIEKIREELKNTKK